MHALKCWGVYLVLAAKLSTDGRVRSQTCELRNEFFLSLRAPLCGELHSRLRLALRRSIFSGASKFFQADCEFLQALGDGFVDVVFFRVAIDG